MAESDFPLQERPPILNPTGGSARLIDARCRRRVFYEAEIIDRNVFGVCSGAGACAARYERSAYAYATGP